MPFDAEDKAQFGERAEHLGGMLLAEIEAFVVPVWASAPRIARIASAGPYAKLTEDFPDDEDDEDDEEEEAGE